MNKKRPMPEPITTGPVKLYHRRLMPACMQIAVSGYEYLTRRQAIRVRDWLTRWIEATEPEEE